DSKNPLDNTRIHPESYSIVDRMAKRLNVSVRELVGNKTLTGHINPAEFCDANFGTQTINDILKELERPALDPRSEKDNIEFSEEITTIDDLREGMILPAKVNNLTAFGAFVDLGIKENGLIHISKMSKDFVKSPSDILKLGQKIIVEVLEVDVLNRRISLKLHTR
ncbi:MAG: S1 RNA-binding domain-containing protein, partial [Muribaculaceae bacterium]|nr:S1 RNA-binding domain-containing protein [Muribaculaceae bacterium]